MTKAEFVELHRHEIAGWILDALTHHRSGAELAICVRGIMRKIDERLGTMYLQLVPLDPLVKEAPKPEANGKHSATGRK